MTSIAREIRAALTCGNCGATAAAPPNGEDYRSLWDEGWRWRGDPAEQPLKFAPKRFVFSCPDCPSVI